MKITDEMIEAGCKARYARWRHFQEDHKPNARKKMFSIITAALSASPAGVVKPPFEFDRYINGKLMAEGVTIERETTIEAAAASAARIASRGPNQEVPVLVLRPARIMSAIEQDGVGVETVPPSSHVAGLPLTPPHEVLKAIAWMKVDPKSRRFEDANGEREVIGFERAEEIYGTIRSALNPNSYQLLEPMGYVGKSSLDMLQSGAVAGCAFTLTPPKVQEVVALYDTPQQPLIEGEDVKALGRFLSSYPHVSQLEWAGVRRLLGKLQAIATPPPQPRASVSAALKGDEQ